MTSVPALFLGVDGGNSKTLALVADERGQVVGSGRAGCSDIYGAVSPETAIGELTRAVLAASTAAGVEPPAIGSAAFSMAGADWPEDHRFLERAIRGLGFGRTVTVVNDALGALRAGSQTGCGVAVVVGTGAATGARGPLGTWHTSWWPEPQGALHLGDQALRAVNRAELGLGPPTSLTDALLALYGVARVEDLLHLRTRREGRGVDRRGEVARVLLSHADAGEPTAVELVRSHGEALGAYAAVAAERTGWVPNDCFPLVLSGGVFRHPSDLLARALVHRMQSTFERCMPVRSTVEPVAGALMLAFDGTGQKGDPTVYGNIVATLPPGAFFAT